MNEQNNLRDRIWTALQLVFEPGQGGYRVEAIGTSFKVFSQNIRSDHQLKPKVVPKVVDQQDEGQEPASKPCMNAEEKKALIEDLAKAFDTGSDIDGSTNVSAAGRNYSLQETLSALSIKGMPTNFFIQLKDKKFRLDNQDLILKVFTELKAKEKLPAYEGDETVKSGLERYSQELQADQHNAPKVSTLSAFDNARKNTEVLTITVAKDNKLIINCAKGALESDQEKIISALGEISKVLGQSDQEFEIDIPDFVDIEYIKLILTPFLENEKILLSAQLLNRVRNSNELTADFKKTWVSKEDLSKFKPNAPRL